MPGDPTVVVKPCILRIVPLLALWVFGCNCPPALTGGPSERTARIAAAAPQLAQPRGISLDELEEKVGADAQFEFLSWVHGDQVLGVSFAVGVDRRRFYYVFRNGELDSVVEPPLFVSHVERVKEPENPGRILSREALDPWDPAERVMDVMSARRLGEDDIRTSLERHCLSKQSHNLWPLLPIGYLGLALRTPLEVVNWYVKARIDPFKIGLGDTSDEVAGAMGEPIGGCQSKDGRTVRIYGSSIDLTAIPESRRYSNVRVVYSAAGVEAVFSNDFFKPCEVE